MSATHWSTLSLDTESSKQATLSLKDTKYKEKKYKEKKNKKSKDKKSRKSGPRPPCGMCRGTA